MTTESKRAIRVILVDDHPSVRRGLAFMINAAPDIELVGEASNGVDAVALAAALLPDVVMMDMNLPKLDGLQATQLIRKSNPRVQVLVLSSFIEPEKVQGALNAGAVGYLIKTVDDDELIRAIRAAASGKRSLSPEAADVLITASQSQALGNTLTDREREVLGLMAQGMNNQEIAGKLFVALPTVKFHITNILSKLGADNRTEAVLIAIKQRLVS